VTVIVLILASVAPTAQSVDENVDEPKDVLLSAWLVVRVTHAHDRSQQVLRTGVTADFTGRDRENRAAPADLPRFRLTFALGH
jgi:hypothetical protein